MASASSGSLVYAAARHALVRSQVTVPRLPWLRYIASEQMTTFAHLCKTFTWVNSILEASGIISASPHVNVPAEATGIMCPTASARVEHQSQ
jgi:hypothetical protein